MSERRLAPPGDKIKLLAKRLAGTTGMECVDELSALERWEGRQLDVLVFACSACDWWFEVSEGRITGPDDLWYCKTCAKEKGYGKA